jgi:DNA-directed RNA polymerase subunit K/omega
MSDNESDYYSDSNSDSDNESVENKVLAKKQAKPIVINAAKKFGNYEEEESEIDDSEPDDAEEDEVLEEDDDIQEGGAEKDEDLEEEIDDADNIDEDNIDEDDDVAIEEDNQQTEKTKKVKQTKTNQLIIEDEDDDMNEDEYEENYLQKFDSELNKNYITEFHPECLNHNYDEVLKLSTVVRNESNIIVDPLHKTLPYLTKYEKARILGQRAKQIETGAKPLVKVPDNIVDSYVIAELELREKKIPFIIKRPIPNGAFEYWHIRDLENIAF